MADFDIGAILNSLSPDDIENIKNVVFVFEASAKKLFGKGNVQILIILYTILINIFLLSK